MNKLSPEEMLDITLNWFATDFDDMGKGEDALVRTGVEHYKAEALIMRKYTKLNENRFMEYSSLIFEKLVTDEYLKREDNGTYSITLTGKMFSQSGGYKSERCRKTKATILQSLQTWLIVIGTVAAGGYGLWELLKALHLWSNNK